MGIIMSTEDSNLEPLVMPPKKQGGARPGAGRPKGTLNKLTAKALLSSIETKCGKPYEILLAEAYYDSIHNPDLRLAYDKLFVSKLVQDHVEVITVDADGENRAFTGFTIVPITAKKTDE